MAQKSIKILIALIMTFSVSTAFGKSCDTATIKKIEEGYLYSTECHTRVGEVLEENDFKDARIIILERRLELRDKMLENADQRTELWMETALALEEHHHRKNKWSTLEKWAYFSLGIIVTGVAVKGAGNLR
jgi:hypothetical protein